MNPTKCRKNSYGLGSLRLTGIHFTILLFFFGSFMFYNRGIFYGPTTHFSPVSVDADFCLHDQIPSATVGSWTGRINTNAVLTVQLLNGDSFSKIIQLR